MRFENRFKKIIIHASPALLCIPRLANIQWLMQCPAGEGGALRWSGAGRDCAPGCGIQIIYNLGIWIYFSIYQTVSSYRNPELKSRIESSFTSFCTWDFQSS